MPLAVQDHPHDDLLEVRPMVLAVAVLAERLSTLLLEIEGRRLEEDQLQPREQVLVSPSTTSTT
jgi:hypothetical protein